MSYTINNQLIAFDSFYESKEKVLLWLEIREALNALYFNKIITPQEYYLMTISIRKKLGLLVVE